MDWLPAFTNLWLQGVAPTRGAALLEQRRDTREQVGFRERLVERRAACAAQELARIGRERVAGDEEHAAREQRVARRDEVETAWAWLDPLLNAWAADPIGPELYSAGTWGPEGADRLIERDRRKWRRP